MDNIRTFSKDKHFFRLHIVSRLLIMTSYNVHIVLAYSSLQNTCKCPNVIFLIREGSVIWQYRNCGILNTGIQCFFSLSSLIPYTTQTKCTRCTTSHHMQQIILMRFAGIFPDVKIPCIGGIWRALGTTTMLTAHL